jgi:hypothetical protein
MPSNPDDRAAREIEELRELFARSGQRPTTRQVDEPPAAARVQSETTGGAEAGTSEDAEPEPQARENQAERPDRAPAGGAVDADADTNEQTRGTGAKGKPRDAGKASRADVPASASQAPVRVPSGSVSSRTLAAEAAADPSALAAATEDNDHDRPTRPVAKPRPPQQQLVLKPHPSSTGSEPTWHRRSKRATSLVVILLAVVFGLGAWLGQTLGLPRPAAQPPTGPSAGTQSPAAVTGAPAPQTTAPQPCLDTARLGDNLIDLLLAKRRGPEMDSLLLAYTTASQQCRAAASR